MIKFDFSKIPELRKAYAYPPAKLVFTEERFAPIINGNIAIKAEYPSKNEWLKNREKFSSMSLDEYHKNLLNSHDEDEILLGVHSVYFWGYISGKDGRITPGRAWARTEWIINGKSNSGGNSKSSIVNAVLEAKKLIESSQISEALSKIMRLKFFGMSFSSKILTFLDPSKCCVYDKVISDRLSQSINPELNSLYISTENTKEFEKQGEIYQRWCRFCCLIASQLNSSDYPVWIDWDGMQYSWRAVDVERAFFAS